MREAKEITTIILVWVSLRLYCCSLRAPLACWLKPSDTEVSITCLPYSVSFQESLNWHRKLSQEALDDRAALGKLVLHLNFQHISGQWHKAELLQWNNMLHQLTERCEVWPISSLFALDEVTVKHLSSNIYYQGLRNSASHVYSINK